MTGGRKIPARKRVQREALAENGVQPTVIGAKRHWTTDPGHFLSPKSWSVEHIIEQSSLFPWKDAGNILNITSRLISKTHITHIHSSIELINFTMNNNELNFICHLLKYIFWHFSSTGRRYTSREDIIMIFIKHKMLVVNDFFAVM